MSWLRQFLFKFRALFLRRKLAQEMANEVALHLEERAQRNIEAGMDPDEARYAAEREFGGVEQVKETGRAEHGFVWLEQLIQDIQYGARALIKNPSYSIVAVLTLALGIGANTAAFTAINALVLNTLPVRSPDELVLFSRTDNARGPASSLTARFSFPLYQQFRADGPTLPAVAALNYAFRTITTDPALDMEAEMVLSAGVTGNFFSVVGVPMALGRGLSIDDDEPATPQPAAVLSNSYWVRHFSSDPSVVGKTMTIDGIVFTIIGVAAPKFTGIEADGYTDIWLPLQMIRRLQPRDAETIWTDDRQHWLNVVGRLGPTASREQAATELNVVYQRHVAEIATRLGSRWERSAQHELLAGKLTLLPGKGGYNTTGLLLKPLFASISTIVVLVLFLACANVASLSLSRAVNRQREFAVRLALGCGRGRLARQVITEATLVALAGAACALLLARWGIDVLIRSLFPVDFVQKVGVGLNPDAGVLGFTSVVALITGILVGLVPALRGSRLDIVTALKTHSGDAGLAGRQRLSRFLVIAQIAASVALLACAGLFVRTIQNLHNVDLGFSRQNLLRVSLQTSRDFNAQQRAALATEMLQNLTALPGVTGATIADGAFGTRATVDFEIIGNELASGEEAKALPAFVGPDFFKTAVIPLVRGRSPNAVDVLSTNGNEGDNSRGVVVITDSLAQAFFPGTDPLGRSIRITNLPGTFEIIGVARDVRFSGAREKSPYVLFLPMMRTLERQTTLVFYLRTVGNPLGIVASVREVARRVAPTVPLRDLWTEEDWFDAQIFQERAIAKVAGLFSAIGLTLASIGLYGILAYNVARRSREIGIRMALGADRKHVLSLVIRQGMNLSLTGCAAGLILTVGLVHLAPKILFGVAAADPITLITTTLVLLVVALLACWVPAYRAVGVDPMLALRAE